LKTGTQIDLQALTKHFQDELMQVKNTHAAINSKLADIESRVDDKHKLEETNSMSWSYIVSKEVDSKILGVTASVETLHQQTKAIIDDRDEQIEIGKRRNCLIIHGLTEPTSTQ